MIFLTSNFLYQCIDTSRSEAHMTLSQKLIDKFIVLTTTLHNSLLSLHPYKNAKTLVDEFCKTRERSQNRSVTGRLELEIDK